MAKIFEDPHSRPGVGWIETGHAEGSLILDGAAILAELEPENPERLAQLFRIVSKHGGSYGVRNGEQFFFLTNGVREKLTTEITRFAYSLDWCVGTGAIPGTVLFDEKGRSITVGPELPVPLEQVLSLLECCSERNHT